MIATKGRSPTVGAALSAILNGLDSPLAIILAGHNGSGKSTFWYERLANRVQLPLLNADRLMLSFLPEINEERPLPGWAVQLRDQDLAWMSIAQHGVASMIDSASQQRVAFGSETVFSHWVVLPDGSVQSKADLILKLQNAGYFVLLLFIGLASANLSIGRVAARVHRGGHAVPAARLVERFSRTQTAIRYALGIANAAILCDNSRSIEQAFTTVHIRAGDRILFDIRDQETVPSSISRWLDVVSPM
jgi:predicted ABC-type ATPase